MEVDTIIVTRGGVQKTTEIGVKADGKSRLNQVTVLPEEPYQQPIKEAPLRIVLEFDDELNGELVKIESIWGKAIKSVAGTIIKETLKSQGMLTIPSDMAGFALLLGDTILKSALNGKVEGIDGFAGKKVFDPATKALLTYTEEQENEPPTNDYWPQTPA